MSLWHQYHPCYPACPCLCLSSRLRQVGDLSAFAVEPRSTRAVLGRAGGGLVLFDLKLGKPSSSVSRDVAEEEPTGHCIFYAGWLAGAVGWWLDGWQCLTNPLSISGAATGAAPLHCRWTLAGGGWWGCAAPPAAALLSWPLPMAMSPCWTHGLDTRRSTPCWRTPAGLQRWMPVGSCWRRVVMQTAWGACR